MKDPKVGKTYTFVRKRGHAFEHTDFTRYEDGSGGFLADGHYSIFECHPDAWRRALAALRQRGFVELAEARESGFVPAEWQPTPENSTLHACSGPAIVTPIPDERTNG
jgi:hypothetical protein